MPEGIFLVLDLARRANFLPQIHFRNSYHGLHSSHQSICFRLLVINVSFFVFQFDEEFEGSRTISLEHSFDQGTQMENLYNSCLPSLFFLLYNVITDFSLYLNLTDLSIPVS